MIGQTVSLQKISAKLDGDGTGMVYRPYTP